MTNRTQTILKTWVIQGELVTCSPLIIGTGKQSEETDILIQRDEQGNPFIPATSLAGCLREYWYSLYPETEKDETVKNFWGYTKEDNGSQSGFVLWDSSISKPSSNLIEIRDGVKIDPKRGIAEPQKKFDYETVRKAVAFTFHFEANIWKDEKEETIETILSILIEAMKRGEVRVGAMGTKGFGRIELKDVTAHLFDFSKVEEVRKWLSEDKTVYDHQTPKPSKNVRFPRIINSDLVLEAFFTLKTSLLIRSNNTVGTSDATQLPDAIHIQSGDTPILPGTSVKGVLRARADRILKTLSATEEKAETLLQDLMGFASEEDEKEKKKSRLYVEEQEISKNTVFEMIQSRIKIDRFTGGALGTALFNFRPLWPKKGETKISLSLRIQDCKPREAGLLLLLLKDLWNGDLTIGGEKNVGRGVLQGSQATITWLKKEYKITQTGETIDAGKNAPELENWVKELIDSVKMEVEK